MNTILKKIGVILLLVLYVMSGIKKIFTFNATSEVLSKKFPIKFLIGIVNIEVESFEKIVGYGDIGGPSQIAHFIRQTGKSQIIATCYSFSQIRCKVFRLRIFSVSYSLGFFPIGMRDKW